MRNRTFLSHRTIIPQNEKRKKQENQRNNNKTLYRLSRGFFSDRQRDSLRHKRKEIYKHPFKILLFRLRTEKCETEFQASRGNSRHGKHYFQWAENQRIQHGCRSCRTERNKQNRQTIRQTIRKYGRKADKPGKCDTSIWQKKHIVYDLKNNKKQ